jgi:hypothetical protein
MDRFDAVPLRDLLDAPTELAACCGFDLCHKYVLYLYLYLYFVRNLLQELRADKLQGALASWCVVTSTCCRRGFVQSSLVVGPVQKKLLTRIIPGIRHRSMPAHSGCLHSTSPPLCSVSLAGCP